MPGQLAYVFWHWNRPDVPQDSYERKLAAFLRALNSEKSQGLLEVLSFRVDGLPWGPQNAKLYEDWYVVDGFSAFGVLNDAAVAGAAQAPHDTVAADYMKGAGGILKSIKGGLPLRDARFATWVEKPVGPTYDSYYEELAKLTGNNKSDLWRRQMVLGPSPQFCIHSEAQLRLPETLKPIQSRIELLRSE